MFEGSVMNKLLLALLMTILTVLCYAVGLSPIQVRDNNSQAIRFSLTTSDIVRDRVNIGAEAFDQISIEGFETTAAEGMPALPFYSATIAIPPQGGFEIITRETGTRSYADIRPKPVIHEGDPVEAYHYDRSFYESSQTYPQVVLKYQEPMVIRDFRVIQLDIYPVRWYAENWQLDVISNIEVEIRFNDKPGVNEVEGYNGYSPVFTNLYESIISNFDYYRRADTPPVNPRILLIHGNNNDQSFISKLTGFVSWKRQKGYDVNAVSTSIAGTTNSAIKNYIQQQYNNPATRPDYIILLGDTNGSFAIPTFYETFSSYNGPGDYPYTYLAGSDYLGDCYIGRISAENLTQLDLLFTKIYLYEKNININPTAVTWLDRMLLVGDSSSSGISTIYTNKFVKEIARRANPSYTFNEVYTSNFASQMNQAINNGVGFFHYRGFYGVSGWNPSEALVNGSKLNHAVFLTCSTGDFANQTSTAESFVRLGTSAQPKGGLTAIGMSTSGTHTLFNNCLSASIFDGIFTHKMRTMGEALLNGRLYLAKVYGNSHPSQVGSFAHWCNLMGDPTVEAFVGIPSAMVLEMPATIPYGTRLVDITVNDGLGDPIGAASVTLFHTTQATVVARGFTNAEGLISLSIPLNLSGEMIVTAAKHDHKPVQETMLIDPDGSLVFSSFNLIDDNTGGSVGNGNSQANAGETVALYVSVRNTTSQALSGVSGTIVCDDPYITLTQADIAFGGVPVGGTAINALPVLFSMANSLPVSHDIRFQMILTDENNATYTGVFHCGSSNSILVPEQIIVSGGANNILDPAEYGTISITIRNQSNLPVSGIQIHVQALNDMLQIINPDVYYGDVGALQVVSPASPINVYARPNLIAGMQIPLQLTIYNNDGFQQIRSINLPIGSPTQNTPLGPDAYGYFIYDVTDTTYPDCPTYEWIEICPSLGGAGTALSLSDQGSATEEGDTVGSQSLAVVNLPFSFRFYGIEYTQITVCSNGFIAFGLTENADFRNYRLPGALGPSPMIAAFWDDLIILGDGAVYKYYDPDNNIFVIQYHKLRNGYDRTSEETFQVIFYNPLYYPTGLGDGKIKIQYKVFNNIDIGNTASNYTHGNFCSIGIKDHTNTQGLEYTFNNQYPTCAAPLTHQRALMITTVPVLHVNAYLVLSEVIINESNQNQIIEPGELVELGIKLSNMGLSGATDVNLTAVVFNQYVSVVSDTTSYDDIAGSGFGMNRFPIVLQISPHAPNDLSVSVMCNITIDGNSWQYPLNLVIRKPVVTFTDFYINDLQGNSDGIADPGEAMKLIINISNPSLVDVSGVTCNVFCPDPLLTFSNPTYAINRIPTGNSMQAVYDIALSPSAVIGNAFVIQASLSGTSFTPVNGSFQIRCGLASLEGDFENNNGGFTPLPATNGWQWGVSSYAGAHSGAKVWGTMLNDNYGANANYTLISPEIYIGSNDYLEFYHRYAIENYYDGGNVKISTNNGQSWTLIHPVGGYPVSDIYSLGEPGYSAYQIPWTQARFNLGSYANQSVRFCWTLRSDYMVQYQGWFIDDVTTSNHTFGTAMLTGSVSLSDPNGELDQTIVSNLAGLWGTHPDADGNFSLFVPYGIHSFKVTQPGYKSAVSPSLTMIASNPVHLFDAQLLQYTPVTHPVFNIDQNELLIHWTPPLDPVLPLGGYKVWRRLNAGAYEMVALRDVPYYNETLSVLGTYHYYIAAWYLDGGESLASATLSFSYPYTDNDDPVNPPGVTMLNANYPNPFNPSTTISFSLKQRDRVKLNIYNLRGQLVKTMINGEQDAGIHRVIWDGTDSSNRKVSTGIYLYRLETSDYTSTRKAMLIK